MSHDPSGVVSFRAWLMSTDASGKRFPPPGDECMKVNETPPHALSRPDAVVAGEERRVEEARLHRFRTERLTAAERAVYDLQEGTWTEITEVVGNDVYERLKFDPMCIAAEVATESTSRKGKVRKTWRVTLRRFVQPANEEMCDRLNISPRQLRTRVQAINRKRREAGLR